MRKLLLLPILLLAACGHPPQVAPSTARVPATNDNQTPAIPPVTSSTTTIAPPTTTLKHIEPPVYRTPTTQCPQPIVDLIHKHFDQFGIEVADWYVGIAWRESNCIPTAASPTQCLGIGQLALPLHRRFFEAQGLDWQTTWMNPDANIKAASLLYAEQGARPWHL